MDKLIVGNIYKDTNYNTIELCITTEEFCKLNNATKAYSGYSIQDFIDQFAAFTKILSHGNPGEDINFNSQDVWGIEEDDLENYIYLKYYNTPLCKVLRW